MSEKLDIGALFQEVKAECKHWEHVQIEISVAKQNQGSSDERIESFASKLRGKRVELLLPEVDESLKRHVPHNKGRVRGIFVDVTTGKIPGKEVEVKYVSIAIPDRRPNSEEGILLREIGIDTVETMRELNFIESMFFKETQDTSKQESE